MKKVFFTFALVAIFLTSFSILQPANAADQFYNCSGHDIHSPSLETPAQLCARLWPLPTVKQSAPLSECGWGQQEACCCQVKSTYECSWRTVRFGVGGCKSNESVGTDCNPVTKPTGENATFRVECCCAKTESEPEEYEPAAFTLPDLQIKIDTISLSEAQCTGEDNTGNCEIPWIAEYINGIYKYGLGIGGILAAIMLMAGGVLWLLSAGDASAITKAKDLIIGSITGLMILVGTYFLLVQINPELTSLKSISVKMIERKILESDVEGQGTVSLDLEGISRVLGVECGSVGVKDLVDKSKGKVTYDNLKRGKTGPESTVYNDCSGYANFVLKCALNKAAGSNTANFFSDQSLWDEKIGSLQAGDLIGWAPTNSPKGEGHVFIYLGDKLFGDCHGGDIGRQSGNCISNNLTLKDIKDSSTRNSDGRLFFKRY